LVALGVFAYVATLNHLHMPKVDAPGGWVQQQQDVGTGSDSKEREVTSSFVWAMAAPSCNLTGGPLFAYLAGGLHLHIEHHVFPTMPSTRLPKVQKLVRDLLRSHGVPYACLPVWDAMCENLKQMRQPGRGIAVPAVAARAHL